MRPTIRLSLAGLLLLSAGPAAAAIDGDTLAMVQAFVKLPTANLPPEHIPRFLAVDPQDLPPDLRQPFLAKRLELNTLKRLAEGRKKGLVRTPEEECAVPKDDQGLLAKFIRIAGFQEITEDEETLVEKQTQCTRRDLMCEFSLLIVREPQGQKKRLRRFLHFRDPLFALVERSREQGPERQTNFFGAATPSCAPRLK